MGRNAVIMLGAVLAVAGLLFIAIPSFTTHQTNEVARLGDLHVNATESKQYFIPPLLSGGVVLVGVVLIGAGMMRRR
jgi:dipeptide/tripeptide permease